MKLLALLPRATISLAIAALTYFSAISPSAAVVYTISELGQLPDAISSSATAINDMGQVVGSTSFSNGSIHATIWNGTTPTDLGTLPGATLSSAMGISNSGQVVDVCPRIWPIESRAKIESILEMDTNVVCNR